MWEEVELERTETCGARAWHAAYDAAREEIVLFGGRRGVSKLETSWSDTWIWNGESWSLRGQIGVVPARRAHSMAYDPRRKVVVMFGGINKGPLGDT